MWKQEGFGIVQGLTRCANAAAGEPAEAKMEEITEKTKAIGIKRYFSVIQTEESSKRRKISEPSKPTPAPASSSPGPAPSNINNFSYSQQITKWPNVLISGAAEGADAAWAGALALCWPLFLRTEWFLTSGLSTEYATRAGHASIHMSFEGHNIKSAVAGTVLRLASDELKAADKELQKVRAHFRRKFSPSGNQYVANLLRRNFHQVTVADSVYAIGTFDSREDNTENITSNVESIQSSSLCISGGTAWACQIFANRQRSLGPFALYFYDQTTHKWYQAEVHSLHPRPLYKWSVIDARPPAPPHGVYAGIGTRELTSDGEAAIKSLYNT